MTPEEWIGHRVWFRPEHGISGLWRVVGIDPGIREDGQVHVVLVQRESQKAIEPDRRYASVKDLILLPPPLPRSP